MGRLYIYWSMDGWFFNGIFVGKYTVRPMDAMGTEKINVTVPNVPVSRPQRIENGHIQRDM